MSTARTGTDRDFGWSLTVLLRAYQTAVGDALDDFAHGPRGCLTLRTVVHGDQPSQLALATHLGIDRTVMTYLIDDLVDAGLVERRPNPGDRRQRKIVATAQGIKTCKSLEKRVRAAEDELFEGFAGDQIEAFRDLLWRLACHVREIGNGIDPCDVATEFLGSDIT